MTTGELFNEMLKPKGVDNVMVDNEGGAAIIQLLKNNGSLIRWTITINYLQGQTLFKRFEKIQTK